MSKRPRKSATILRELAVEFEPDCATRNECIDEKQIDCPVLRYRSLLRELRRAIATSGKAPGR